MKSSGDFTKILLYGHPTDMRKQSQSLAVIVEDELGLSPFEEGCLFIFCNRKRDILKALYFDRAGFCMWVKKLDEGRFPWVKNENGTVSMAAKDIDLVCDGVDVFKRHKKLIFSSTS